MISKGGEGWLQNNTKSGKIIQKSSGSLWMQDV